MPSTKVPPSVKSQYKTLIELTQSDLDIDVTAHLQLGWRLHGDQCVVLTDSQPLLVYDYCQAVTLRIGD